MAAPKRQRQTREFYRRPLTPQESAFAAEHYDLIARFLNRFQLDEEWFDAVVFRYLLSVKRWCCLPELRRYSFTTISFAEMKSAVGNARRAQARRPETVSLYEPLSGAENLTLADTLAAPYNLEEDIIRREQGDLFMSYSETQWRDAIDMKLKGLSGAQISAATGIPAKAIYSQWKKWALKYGSPIEKDAAEKPPVKREVENALALADAVENAVRVYLNGPSLIRFEYAPDSRVCCCISASDGLLTVTYTTRIPTGGDPHGQN